MTAARLKIVPPPAPAPLATYVPAPSGARLRVDELASKTNRLSRVFSGSFVTGAGLADARTIAAELLRDAKLLVEVLG